MGAFLGAFSMPLWGTQVHAAYKPSEVSLYKRAAKRGIVFGAAVSQAHLAQPDVVAALIHECAIITPENEMKWRSVEQQPDAFRFEGADALMAFAQKNGKRVRGHTPFWHQAIPKWALQNQSPEQTTQLALKYAQTLMQRYAGKIDQWDVANEFINPPDGLLGGLRNSALIKTTGIDAIADVYRLAAEIDPRAKLFYNDYGIEYYAPDTVARQRACIELMSELLKRGAPLQGFGIQAHLKVGNRFDDKNWSDFLAEISDMGLQIAITELDIDDVRLPADIPSRDNAVAEHAKRFLDVTLANKAVKTVVTWGLSDRHSWLSQSRPRADKLQTRGLPFDLDMTPKPMWNALIRAFDSAPNRGK